MKAYKITGKLGDICSFVGGNEVKKGDTVYFHSESDMKHQCVAKTQENDMSIEAMKQALYLIRNQGDVGVDEWIAAEAALCTAIEQAEKRDVERSSTESKETFDQPVTWLAPRYEGGHENLAVADQNEFGAFPVYTTPQPQRKPLSDEEILHRVDTHVGGPSPSYPLDNSDWLNFARAIEAAHGIKE